MPRSAFEVSIVGRLPAEAGCQEERFVTHYWRAKDVEPEQVASVGPGRYYLKRPPPAVPAG